MSQYVLHRLQAIQDELDQLKRLVTHELNASHEATHIKGLWKDVNITEEDLANAKNAVFRTAKDWE